MDQIKIVANEKPSATVVQKQYNQTAYTVAQNTIGKKSAGPAIFQDKTENQEVIERRLVGQLGDRYTNAHLLELSRNNYLISNRVRLPVFGQAANLIERDKDSIGRVNFVKMKDEEALAKKNLME